MVRINEMRESIKIVRQASRRSDGPVLAKVPASSSRRSARCTSAPSAARETGIYLISDGSVNPTG